MSKETLLKTPTHDETIVIRPYDDISLVAEYRSIATGQTTWAQRIPFADVMSAVDFETKLDIESDLHRKMFAVLDEHPHVMETKRLRAYLDFFFNPGEIIYQEAVVLPDERDLEDGWEGTETAVFCAEGKPEVVIEENGFLMHTKIPHERDEEGGMWVEIHSVESGVRQDDHDKFKRMLGQAIRVTVEILDKPS